MNWEDGYESVTMVSLTKHIIMNRLELIFIEIDIPCNYRDLNELHCNFFEIKI